MDRTPLNRSLTETLSQIFRQFLSGKPILKIFDLIIDMFGFLLSRIWPFITIFFVVVIFAFYIYVSFGSSVADLAELKQTFDDVDFLSFIFSVDNWFSLIFSIFGLFGALFIALGCCYLIYGASQGQTYFDLIDDRPPPLSVVPLTIDSNTIVFNQERYPSIKVSEVESASWIEDLSGKKDNRNALRIVFKQQGAMLYYFYCTDEALKQSAALINEAISTV